MVFGFGVMCISETGSSVSQPGIKLTVITEDDLELLIPQCGVTTPSLNVLLCASFCLC